MIFVDIRVKILQINIFRLKFSFNSLSIFFLKKIIVKINERFTSNNNDALLKPSFPCNFSENVENLSLLLVTLQKESHNHEYHN